MGAVNMWANVPGSKHMYGWLSNLKISLTGDIVEPLISFF